MAEKLGTVEYDVRANLKLLEQDLAQARSKMERQGFKVKASLDTSTAEAQLKRIFDKPFKIKADTSELETKIKGIMAKVGVGGGGSTSIGGAASAPTNVTAYHAPGGVGGGSGGGSFLAALLLAGGRGGSGGGGAASPGKIVRRPTGGSGAGQRSVSTFGAVGDRVLSFDSVDEEVAQTQTVSQTRRARGSRSVASAASAADLKQQFTNYLKSDAVRASVGLNAGPFGLGFQDESGSAGKLSSRGAAFINGIKQEGSGPGILSRAGRFMTAPIGGGGGKVSGAFSALGKPFGLTGGQASAVAVGAFAVKAITGSAEAESNYQISTAQNYAGDPAARVRALYAKANATPFLGKAADVIGNIGGFQFGSAYGEEQIARSAFQDKQRQGGLDRRNQLVDLKVAGLSASDDPAARIAALNLQDEKAKNGIEEQFRGYNSEVSNRAAEMFAKSDEAGSRKWYKLGYKTDAQEAEQEMLWKEANSYKNNESTRLNKEKAAALSAAGQANVAQKAALQRQVNAQNIGLFGTANQMQSGIDASRMSLTDSLGAQRENLRGAASYQLTSLNAQIAGTANPTLQAAYRQQQGLIQKQYGVDQDNLNKNFQFGTDDAAGQNRVSMFGYSAQQFRTAGNDYLASREDIKARLQQTYEDERMASRGLNASDPIQAKRLGEISQSAQIQRGTLQSQDQRLRDDFAQGLKQLTSQINTARQALGGDRLKTGLASIAAERESANYKQPPEVVAKNNELFDLQEKQLRKDVGRERFLYGEDTAGIRASAGVQRLQNLNQPLTAQAAQIEEETTRAVRGVNPDEPGADDRVKAIKELGKRRLQGVKKILDNSTGFAQAQGAFMNFGALKEPELDDEAKKANAPIEAQIDADRKAAAAQVDAIMKGRGKKADKEAAAKAVLDASEKRVGELETKLNTGDDRLEAEKRLKDAEKGIDAASNKDFKDAVAKADAAAAPGGPGGGLNGPLKLDDTALALLQTIANNTGKGVAVGA